MTRSSNARKSSIKEHGRQRNIPRLQIVERKPQATTIFVQSVKDQILYRWRKGVKEQALASELGVPRPHIEEILHEQIFGQPSGPNRPSGGPGNCLPLKRAA